jgi:hypothetical protein
VAGNLMAIVRAVKSAKLALLPSIFTIVIDERPVLAFEVQNIREAYELSRERWLLADLAAAKSGGAPLWHGHSKVRARLSTHDEAAIYAASAKMPEEDLNLVYLVNLDGNDGLSLKDEDSGNLDRDNSGVSSEPEVVVVWRKRNKFAWRVVDEAGKTVASGTEQSVTLARESAARVMATRPPAQPAFDEEAAFPR